MFGPKRQKLKKLTLFGYIIGSYIRFTFKQAHDKLNDTTLLH